MSFKDFLDAYHGYDLVKIKECFDNGLVIDNKIFRKNHIAELVSGNLVEMLKVFLKYGPGDDFANHNQEFLLKFAKENNNDLVKLCLDHGSPIDYQNEEDSDTALHIAVREKNSEIAKMLLECGASINYQNMKDGDTALHIAVREKNSEIAKMLLECGASMYIQNNYGNNPFSLTVRYKLIEILEMFLRHETKLNSDNSFKKYFGPKLANSKFDGEYVIFRAIYTIEELKLLLDHGACVHVKNKHNDPLLMAGGLKSANVVEMLIKYGASVNAYNKNWKTPLMEACDWGRIDVAETLIKHGARINAKNKDGWSALGFACKNVELQNLLLKHNIEIDAKNGQFLPKDIDIEDEKGQTEFMRSLYHYYRWEKYAKPLLNKGANINHRRHDGETALIKASRCEEHDRIKFLLDNGAEVNIQDNKGRTALIILCLEKHYNGENIKKILDKEALLDIQDMTGNTALMHAIKEKKIWIAKLLLEHGASVDFINKDGENALFMTAKYCNFICYELVKTILDKGSFLDVKNNKGATALMQLVLLLNNRYNIEIEEKRTLELLLERGASVNIEDNDGKTALDMATKIEIVTILLKYDAKPGKGKPTWKDYFLSMMQN